jgi:O6-methylguanine-DNA--protein-cysteine methyltransferase
VKPAVVAVLRSIASPVGVLTLSASPRGLTGVQFENDIVERFVVADSFSAKERVQAAGYIATVEAQLGEYFARQRTVFAVKLDLLGTPFQVEVWNSLARIPYGETTSYGQQGAPRRCGPWVAPMAVTRWPSCCRATGWLGQMAR